MRLDQELRVRGMTDAEMDELTGDPVWMDQVAQLVGAIQFVKSSVN
jgi:hypothetical protein